MNLKFRAWSFTNKIMYDRVLAGNTLTDDPCSSVWDEKKNNWLNFDKHCGVIMQFTGLLDKNGKEIYEGDLLQIWIDGYKQTPRYEVEDAKELYLQCNRDDNYYRIESMEVIGNIYEVQTK